MKCVLATPSERSPPLRVLLQLGGRRTSTAFQAALTAQASDLRDFPRPTLAALTWDPTWTDEQGKSRLPIIPSHEISGVVAKVGTDALNMAAGDEVYGLIDFFRNGAAAEFAIAKVAELAPKPRSVDHLHAAAIPLSALTAWQAFRTHAFLRAGQRVLIHGGAGGVGSFAVQLAKHLSRDNGWSGYLTGKNSTQGGDR